MGQNKPPSALRLNREVSQGLDVGMCYPLEVAPHARNHLPEHPRFQHREDSPQASRTCPAHKAQKNRFRLVVGGVRRRHCVDPALIDEREKVSITQVARRFLDPAPPLAGSLPDLSLTLDEL